MMKTTKDRLLSLIMEGARQNRQEGFGLFKGDMFGFVCPESGEKGSGGGRLCR